VPNVTKSVKFPCLHLLVQLNWFFLDYLTLEDGRDRLPRNVDNKSTNLRRATSGKGKDFVLVVDTAQGGNKRADF
jgi:hypothetical protein